MARCLLALAACGRIGFDRTGSDAGGSGAPPFALSGMQLLMPCGASLSATVCACDTSPITVARQLGGTSTDHYDVQVWIRGGLETMTYKNGTSSGSSVYVDGTPTDPDWGIYKIVVSSPSHSYWINSASSILTHLFAFDYQWTLPIDGDATVALVGDCQDGTEYKNSDGSQPVVIAGVATSPSPYDGQFAQLDVLDATLR